MESLSTLGIWLAGLASADGTLLVVPLVLPVVGLLLALVLGGRYLGPFVLLLTLLGLAAAAAIAIVVFNGGEALGYRLGGWVPPLGVSLEADGLSVVLLLTSAVVILGVAAYAQRDFRPEPGAPETRGSLAFWMLLLGVWAGLNTVALAQDLFTLFVALELLTFSAVPLVSLDGRAETLAAALRYLLFALLGSVLYLLGAVLLYGTYGTLDIALLAQGLGGYAVGAVPVPALVALALMTVGLMAKTALVPLHLWLPPAHAGAPPAASAVLSALVVKGSFFLLLRIWFDLMPGLLALPVAQILGVLGAVAILLGNLMALQQARLKLLVAYSTVAQIGYLFLIFPLAADAPGWALAGGTLQVVSHALAKGAMFLAAGLVYGALGHDRIRDLAGVARALPLTVLAFGLAGLSLVGIQPSGGYLVKTLLGGVAETSNAWWWGLVLDAGGLLTAAYLVWVLGQAITGSGRTLDLVRRPRPSRELVVLTLAVSSLLLGLIPAQAFDLIAIGRASGPDPIAAAWAGAIGWRGLAAGLWPVAVVAALVLIFAPWGAGARVGPLGWPARGAAALGGVIDGLDVGLRRWPVAGCSLLVLLIGLAAGLLVGS
jgi:formate hydrogenlyase subunit 3/multisubunit Na+/H+ antiporter MnhD subunit